MMEKVFWEVIFDYGIERVVKQAGEILKQYAPSPDILRLLLPEIKGRISGITPGTQIIHADTLIRAASLCLVCAVSESLRAGGIDAND